MPTRNVVLTKHQSALIDDLVASGRYQNASEALRAGLRLLQTEEETRAALIRRIDGSLADHTATGPLTEDGETTIRRAFARARQDRDGANAD
ncbi:Antitoxin ParD1 [Roseovarius tolerans]|uniref:Antitoxin ParD1 n=1 Tax=Roseovarius tolerans TaxID=74031 RepID=A0A0L6CX21_9RHOB|nr:type II toxin-antitoxin system ParD family antitoxin [Roseovarius tolerans]KNX42332.1 Antitoxin ParD1 [Roseovarius tolerans]